MAPPALHVRGGRGTGTALPLPRNTADGDHTVGGRLQQPQAGGARPVLRGAGRAAGDGGIGDGSAAGMPPPRGPACSITRGEAPHTSAQPGPLP